MPKIENEREPRKTGEARAAIIRELNDELRVHGPNRTGRWMITQGVEGLIDGDAESTRELVQVIQTFCSFEQNNDPYREHDFGAFEFKSIKCFWKIDYYDLTMNAGSEDPADKNKTMRVLTIMRADEY